MSGFSIDWLDLREAADRRARDSGLRAWAVQWLEGELLSDQGTEVNRSALGATDTALSGSTAVLMPDRFAAEPNGARREHVSVGSTPESRRQRSHEARRRADPTFAKVAQTDRPLVVDLGAGTGSTLRALDLPDQLPVSWRLVDHDPSLLAEAQRRHSSTHSINTCAADLSDIGSLPINDARLVTASALFDLVSAEFIEALATALKTQCQQHPVGLYAALNYDGSTRWTPAHPLDDIVLEAFNQDQGRDKGFGPALGPEAAKTLPQVFSQAGFTVYSADSPWVLDGADRALVSALITGIAAAVAGYPGLDAEALADWVQFRQAKVAFGTCTVGHTDLLALPI